MKKPIKRVITDGCYKQFPECPKKVDDSCKVCPFYRDGLRKLEKEK